MLQKDLVLTSKQLRYTDPYAVNQGAFEHCCVYYQRWRETGSAWRRWWLVTWKEATGTDLCVSLHLHRMLNTLEQQPPHVKKTSWQFEALLDWKRNFHVPSKCEGIAPRTVSIYRIEILFAPPTTGARSPRRWCISQPLFARCEWGHVSITKWDSAVRPACITSGSIPAGGMQSGKQSDQNSSARASLNSPVREAFPRYTPDRLNHCISRFIACFH